MMIFLSHNYNDKPVVEPVAIRLGQIFGQQSVFYDAWSIQPGDGIIQKMNEGMKSPDFVFFFVSAKSLASKMVELEWQNALYKSTRGECKIVPVRVDGSTMPPILLQNLYIDMYAHGIEAAIVQIVNVIQGNNTFTPQHLGFSNLTFQVSGDATKELTIQIKASHLMEPNPEFLILVRNSEDEVAIDLNGGQPHRGGLNTNVPLNDGTITNVFAIAPLGGAITPSMPMTVTLKPKGSVPVSLRGVFHKKTHDKYEAIPPSASQ
jgi:TIR domain